MSLNQNNCKLVLLGDSGVGKTSIISQYISGAFYNNTPSTNGASYTSKKVIFKDLNKSITLDIWDTAGQEKYKSLIKFFYKDASIAILVYDITNKQSFESLKTYWIKQLKDLGEKHLILCIAGNKCDLYNKEQVSEKEGKKFAEDIGAFFELTSAKNNIGINELYMKAAYKYLNNDFCIYNNKKKGEEETEDSTSVKLSNKGKTIQKINKCC